MASGVLGATTNVQTRTPNASQIPWQTTRTLQSSLFIASGSFHFFFKKKKKSTTKHVVEALSRVGIRALKCLPALRLALWAVGLREPAVHDVPVEAELIGDVCSGDGH